jgi:hypothetical protein
MNGYDNTKQVASRQHSEWLDAIVACVREAERTRATPPNDGVFAGAWVKATLARDSRVRNLQPLANWGVIEKVETTRGGHCGYYRIVDDDGVRRALVELGRSV